MGGALKLLGTGGKVPSSALFNAAMHISGVAA